MEVWAAWSIRVRRSSYRGSPLAFEGGTGTKARSLRRRKVAQDTWAGAGRVTSAGTPRLARRARERGQDVRCFRPRLTGEQAPCQKRLQTLDVQRQTHQVPLRLVHAPHAESPEAKDLLHPAAQPLALRVALPARGRGQLLNHVSLGACAGPGSPSSCPRAPAPRTRRALQVPTSPVHCSSQHPQAPSRAARRRSL